MSERDDTSPVGEEYHGRVNRPTWIVHQWLSAEAESAAAARSIVENAGDVHHGAQDLAALIEAENPLAREPSLYSDLLGWALSAVAWVDVAEPFAPESSESDGRPDGPPDSDGSLAVHPPPSGN